MPAAAVIPAPIVYIKIVAVSLGEAWFWFEPASGLFWFGPDPGSGLLSVRACCWLKPASGSGLVLVRACFRFGPPSG